MKIILMISCFLIIPLAALSQPCPNKAYRYFEIFNRTLLSYCKNDPYAMYNQGGVLLKAENLPVCFSWGNLNQAPDAEMVEEGIAGCNPTESFNRAYMDEDLSFASSHGMVNATSCHMTVI